MKKLLPFLILLLLTSCGTKKFYTLGENLKIKNEIQYSETIEVVQVSVPRYLQEYKIVKQVTPRQVELIKKAQWLVPMEERLTEILIDYLQQSLNNPNVHLYPWDADNEPKKRVSVEVKKFIASSKEVMLIANYKVMDFTNNTKQQKSFRSSIKTDGSMEGMMSSMEKVYLELLSEIKVTLLNNKGV